MLRVRTTLSGFQGGPGLATHYFTCSTENAAAAAACRGYVRDFWGMGMAKVLHNGVDWTVQTEVDSITSADGNTIDTFTDSTAYTDAGSGGASSAAPTTAALVHFSTGTWVGGRRLAGRSFISPIAAAVIDVSGQFDGTALAARNAELVAWRATLPAGDNQVIWHRPVSGAGGYSGVVTGAVLSQQFAVLTSRRD